MDVTPLIPQSRKVITGYGEGGFKINNEFIAGSLLITPGQVVSLPITDIGQLSPESLQPIFADHAELVLFGTGTNMKSVNASLRAELKAKRITSDIMDTGAACRTYNVLLSEERKVAAILIAV